MLSRHYTPALHCKMLPEDSASRRQFSGYASVWDSVDSYGDTVERGAFAGAIEAWKDGAAVRMFYNHDSNQVLGKWITLEENDTGLYVRGELTPGHSLADDVWASIQHGALDGMSIGFYPRKSEEIEGGGRLLQDVDLREISIVSMPAEQRATITSVKNQIDAIENIRDLEKLLRGSFSKSESIALIGRIKSLLSDSAAQELAALKARMERKARTAQIVEMILKGD